jgi:hypothetical protein
MLNPGNANQQRSGQGAARNYNGFKIVEKFENLSVCRHLTPAKRSTPQKSNRENFNVTKVCGR